MDNENTETKALADIDAMVKVLAGLGWRVVHYDCIEKTSRVDGTKKIRLTLDMGTDLEPTTSGTWA